MISKKRFEQLTPFAHSVYHAKFAAVYDGCVCIPEGGFPIREPQFHVFLESLEKKNEEMEKHEQMRVIGVKYNREKNQTIARNTS